MVKYKTKKLVSPKVFIGSSTEALDIARTLHEIFNDYKNIESILWKDDVFTPGLTTIESLINATIRYQFAVFILTPDDKTYIRGNIFPSARSNLIFEAGLFMGRIGREKTFLMIPEDYKPENISDWDGITVINFIIKDNIKSSLRAPANQIVRTINKMILREEASVSFYDILQNSLSESPIKNIILKRLESLKRSIKAEVPVKHKDEIRRIADLLEKYEEKNWTNREFNILFNQYTTDKITIYDLFNVISNFEPKKINLIFDSLMSLFNQHPKKGTFNAYELFSRHMDTYSAEIRSRFDARKMLSQVHLEDLTNRNLKAGQVKHLGIFPANLEGVDLSEVSEVMKKIRNYGKDVIQSGVNPSPKDIVISFWKPSIISWMVITATDSDKNDLLLPSETPFIIRRDLKLYYFGDQMRFPSSETIPHWYIHEKLSDRVDDEYNWILHIHSEPINKLATECKDKNILDLPGNLKIPTVEPVEYGTMELGMEIVSVMLDNNARAATVKHHGQWFVGHQFSNVLNTALRCHTAAKQLIKKKRN